MPDLPNHPDNHDPSGQVTGHTGTTGGLRRGSLAGVVLAAVLMVLMVLLHLTGVVGPGSH